MAVKSVLLRPIEITSDNNTFTVTYGGGAPDVINLAPGGYASVLTLLDEVLDRLIADVNGSFVLYLTSDWKVYIEESHATWSLAWTDKALGVLLGFNADVALGYNTTSTYTPTHMWLPTYPRADADPWKRVNSFRGSNAADGSLAGLSLSPGRWERELKWAAEADTNTLETRCVSSFSYGGTTYYPQKERCFERFIHNAMTASTEETTAEGINVKGFYYVYDRTEYEGSGNLPASMSGGGLDTELSSSADNYAFCNLERRSYRGPTPSIKDMLTYWDISIDAMTTLSAPTWNQNG